MNCYEFKGGNGTASRRGRLRRRTFTVGAFVQANFGSRAELTVAGRHVGPQLLDDNPLDERLVRGRPRPQAAPRRRLGHRDRRHRRSAAARPVQGAGAAGSAGPGPHRHHGQPLLRRHLPCLLHRGRARAWPARFPSARSATDEFGTLHFVPWGRMDDLYTAVVQAVEEAVLNALVVNDDMIGRDGHRSRDSRMTGCGAVRLQGHNRKNRRCANDRSGRGRDRTRHGPSPGRSAASRPRLLVAGLSVVVLTVAVLQTAVVPVLGIIAEQLDVSSVARQLGGHRQPARRRGARHR